MAKATPFPYTAYKQILDVLRKESSRLLILTYKEWQATRAGPTDPANPRIRPTFDVTRTITMLSTVIRRSALIAQHITASPATDEEREGRVEQRLELVFSVLAKHKVDLDTYYRWVDADLQREMEAELQADLRDDDRDDEPDLDTDMLGRRPMILVGELCCDFGIAIHTLPVEWLDPAPPELRLLCARAAAAYVRPSRSAGKSLRYKGHSHPRS